MNSRCHCGAIRYRIEGAPRTHSLCHCSDCRRHAGAPLAGSAMFAREVVKMEKGTPKTYKSSEYDLWNFCRDCGTGLFYTNENILPGIVDVQSATLDDPNAAPPRAHVQVAERITWMARAHKLLSFDRYPLQS